MATNLIFLACVFCTNVIVTSMLLFLGGTKTVEALAGINYKLASFLCPCRSLLVPSRAISLIVSMCLSPSSPLSHFWVWRPPRSCFPLALGSPALSRPLLLATCLERQDLR